MGAQQEPWLWLCGAGSRLEDAESLQAEMEKLRLPLHRILAGDVRPCLLGWSAGVGRQRSVDPAGESPGICGLGVKEGLKAKFSRVQ